MFTRAIIHSKRLVFVQKPVIFWSHCIKPIEFSKMLFSTALGLKQKFEESGKNQKKIFGDNIKENILTIPNGLCVLRISLTPLVGYLVIQESFLYACILFTFAGFTDLIDGWIARKFPSQRSSLGSILDPIADKVLISVLFLTLTYVDLIPVYLTAIVIFRDLSLIIGALIRRYQLLEPPFTFRRFFDPSVSSLNVSPTQISKYNTVLQISFVSLSLAAPVFGYVGHPALQGLGLLTGGTTIYSGLQYLFGDAIRPVKNNKK